MSTPSVQISRGSGRPGTRPTFCTPPSRTPHRERSPRRPARQHTAVVDHRVRDYDAWKPVFDEHEDLRRSHGGFGLLERVEQTSYADSGVAAA